jgi:hypothetical protein
MKKLFVVLAVASLGFVSCNNESETTTTDDTITNIDSPVVAPPVVTPDTINAGTDTLGKKDTLKK